MLPAPPHCASIRPPGLSASNRRLKRRSWSRIQWNTAFEKTASTGSRRRSSARSWSSTSARSPIFSRALATIAGAASTAITLPFGTRSMTISVTRPLPQPASSTVSSPRSSSRSITAAAHSTCGVETRSYVAASQSRRQSEVVTGPSRSRSAS